MTPQLRAFVAIGCLAACEQTTVRYGNVDTPAPDPVALGEVAGTQAKATGKVLSDEDAAKCGRGTGRNPEGHCVQLGLRDVTYVQRVQIPAGSFVMGFVPDSYDATASHETPAVRWPGQPPRLVESKGFWIDLHEVTRQEYEACVDSGKCSAAVCPDGDDPVGEHSPEIARFLPQTCVTHAQAEAFCAAQGGRLPTEIEWEYAARGIDARVYPWGNEVRDDLVPGLLPAGRLRADTSYFGILGMGTNAVEWVADLYDAEAGLRPYLSGTFRDKNGPLAKSLAQHEQRLACGDSPAAGCRASKSADRYVVKASIAGSRRGVLAKAPAHPQAAGLEGWDERPAQAKLGFRCAEDLDPQRDTPLTVPDDAPAVPLMRATGGLELFGGVVESASHREAKRFCERLRVPANDGTDAVHSDWRLPTLEEIQSTAENFRGPGPMWTAGGAAGQQTTKPDDPWLQVDADAGESLPARCVRTAG